MVELAGAQWRDSQKSLTVSVELACLIKKLHLPGSSQDEDDWDFYFFFLGSRSVKDVFMQILKFPSYLPKLRRLAETLHYKRSGRWTLVFNIIPGKVRGD